MCFFLSRCLCHPFVMPAVYQENEEKEMLKEILNTTKALRADLDNIKVDNANFISFMSNSVVKQQETEARCISMENTIVKLSEKIEKLEKISRENNAIIYNFSFEPTNEMNVSQQILNIFNTLIRDFEVNTIDDIYLLGKQTHKRPVLIKFKTQIAKRNFFKHAATLRQNKLFLANDLSREERSERRKLKLCVSTLNKISIKASIRKNKILMNGQLFDPDEISKKFGINLEVVHKSKPNVQSLPEATCSSNVNDGGEVRASIPTQMLDSQVYVEGPERLPSKLGGESVASHWRDPKENSFHSAPTTPILQKRNTKAPKRKIIDETQTTSCQKLNKWFRPSNLQSNPPSRETLEQPESVVTQDMQIFEEQIND